MKIDDKSVDFSVADLDTLEAPTPRRKGVPRVTEKCRTELALSLNTIREDGLPALPAVIAVAKSYTQWGQFKEGCVTNLEDQELFNSVKKYLYSNSVKRRIVKEWGTIDLADTVSHIQTFIFIKLTSGVGIESYRNLLKFLDDAVDKSVQIHKRYKNYIGDKTLEFSIGDGYDFRVGEPSRNADPADSISGQWNPSIANSVVELTEALVVNRGQSVTEQVWVEDYMADDTSAPHVLTEQKDSIKAMLEVLNDTPTRRARGVLGGVMAAFCVLDMPGGTLNMGWRENYEDPLGLTYSGTGEKIEIDRGYRIFRDTINNLG